MNPETEVVFSLRSRMVTIEYNKYVLERRLGITLQDIHDHFSEVRQVFRFDLTQEQVMALKEREKTLISETKDLVDKALKEMDAQTAELEAFIGYTQETYKNPESLAEWHEKWAALNKQPHKELNPHKDIIFSTEQIMHPAAGKELVLDIASHGSVKIES